MGKRNKADDLARVRQFARVPNPLRHIDPGVAPAPADLERIEHELRTTPREAPPAVPQEEPRICAWEGCNQVLTAKWRVDGKLLDDHRYCSDKHRNRGRALEERKLRAWAKAAGIKP